jgi:hypothetical protein
VPATGVVAEAMVCLTLADFVLEKFGGDSIAELLDNVALYRARIAGPGSSQPGRRSPGGKAGGASGGAAPAASE